MFAPYRFYHLLRLPNELINFSFCQTYIKDVRDICDDKKLVDHFNGIAKDIKKDSGLGKVIPSLRLAPAGVMCLIYPLVNEEDFENGYHNTTKFLYNDWVTDSPFHTSTLRRTLDVQNGEEAKVTVTGPYQVESSSRTNKTIISESLFFTHLGVNLPGSKLTVDGMDYHSWGMIVMEFNWDLFNAVALHVQNDRNDELFASFDANKFSFIRFCNPHLLLYYLLMRGLSTF